MTLDAAVVGCGLGAGINHADGYAAADGAELVAVCDLDADRARSLADEHGVAWYDDADAMLEAESPDVVSVATPERAHVEPTIAALEAGADVFCEKIMAHSLADAREMIAAADRNDRVLGVDYNYRHVPVFDRVERAISSGELGTVRLASFDVHSFCWHHVLDLLRYWFGEPTAISASLRQDPDEAFWDVDDLCYVPSPAGSATVEFGETLVSVGASRRSELDEHLISFSVAGDEARVALRDVHLEDTSGTPAPGPLESDLRDLPQISLAESFHRSVDAFVDALRAGERPPTTGTDGLRVMELEAAAVRSDRTGRRIEL